MIYSVVSGCQYCEQDMYIIMPSVHPMNSYTSLCEYSYRFHLRMFKICRIFSRNVED